jgi:hypothetical protein
MAEEEEGMATHEQSDLIETSEEDELKAPDEILWMMDIYKIDTVQSRAQIEALRTIAEELHELNVTLDHIDTLLSQRG